VFIKLLVPLTIVPLVELYLILLVGRQFGAPTTVAAIFLTGATGAWLVRRQGFDLLRRIQGELARGAIPAGELLDGALILAGGVLLLTPGFCTDLFGLALLLPLSREIFKEILRRWLQRQVDRGVIVVRRL